MALSPTDEISQELQHAYGYFNRVLFGNTLPACIISYQRESGTYGYFRRDQFVRKTAESRHEIALHPSFIAVRSLTSTCATLVHQMCRLQADVTGARKSRSSYHNRDLAVLLKQVGLLPRQDGKPDGRETGHRVGHVIEADGPFERACKGLIDSGFVFSWVDKQPPAMPADATREEWLGRLRLTNSESTSSVKVEHSGVLDQESAIPPRRNPHLPEAAYEALRDILDYRDPPAAASRHRYECPGCKKKFWAGIGIYALCIPCKQPFVDTDPRTTEQDTKGHKRVKRIRRVPSEKRKVKGP